VNPSEREGWRERERVRREMAGGGERERGEREGGGRLKGRRGIERQRERATAVLKTHSLLYIPSP
jgi:hypothetical protein